MSTSRPSKNAGDRRTNTRILVVGAGAMGSLFAAQFAQAGFETWVYDVWAEDIERIREFGLTERHGDTEDVIPMHATTDPREAGVVDLVLIFVKYNQTRQATVDIAPVVGPDTTVLTLQNGLGNVKLIRDVLPDTKLLCGFTTLTSELLGPGLIEASYAGSGQTSVWSADGAPSDACEQAVQILNRSDINASADPDIERHIWEKLIVNCCLNTLCAITGLSVGDLVDHSEIAPVLDGITDEVVSVARTKQIALTREDAHFYLQNVITRARAHYPSMLRDVRAGQQTEIECLNGAVIREAERFGIDVPFNRFAYATIRVIEDSYAKRMDTASRD